MNSIPKIRWSVSGANAMVLKHWIDCLCHVASGRTHNRIRSPRWTASSFWVYAGKGSRQIRSVTLEKGLAQRATWDSINYCSRWGGSQEKPNSVGGLLLIDNREWCLRLIANFELTRTRRIRLFNKNIALWWSERLVDTMWFLPSALNVNVEKFK
jgi:hypothetical protein